MVTLILKRNVELEEIQLTQKNLVEELWKVPGGEMLLEDSWQEGLKKVRTPFVCFLEGDCLLSDDYLPHMLSSFIDNGHNPYKGTGGYTKLAMVFPLLGMGSFDNLILGYRVEGDEVYPSKQSLSRQVGALPGAILRYASIKDSPIDWDEPNILKLSAIISSYLWDTNRRVDVYPDATYVSTNKQLDRPCLASISDKVRNIYEREQL